MSRHTCTKPPAHAPRRGSAFESRGDFLGDLGSPLLDRLEPRQVAAVDLGLAAEVLLGLVEVDLETARLRHVPRRVTEHLDAIALGILEINRPGVAMADRVDALAAGLAHFAEGALHVGERADVERDLLHHRRLDIRLGPGTKTT